MTTRKQALTALRDAMVEGDVMAIYIRDVFDMSIHDAVALKNGDMNAALAFVAAVLPDFTTWQYYSGDGHCIVGYGPGPADYDEAHHEKPARALTIAALNALIELEDAK